MAVVPKNMLTEFGIHYRLESCGIDFKQVYLQKSTVSASTCTSGGGSDADWRDSVGPPWLQSVSSISISTTRTLSDFGGKAGSGFLPVSWREAKASSSKADISFRPIGLVSSTNRGCMAPGGGAFDHSVSRSGLDFWPSSGWGRAGLVANSILMTFHI